MKKHVKHISLIAVLFMSALYFSACFGGTSAPAAASTATTIKVGLIAPLTGNTAMGMYQIAGSEMAIKEINEAGGIDGKVKIEWFVEDDEGTPANSVSVAQKLITQTGVDVIIGAQNSSCTLAVMELTEANKIPHIAPTSTAIGLTQHGKKYIFRLAGSDMIYAETVIKYLMAQGYKTGAILYESSDFGLSGFTCLTKAAEQLGFNIIASEMYTPGDRDFSTQLTTIKQKSPDAVIPWGYFTEAALIIQQMRQYDIKSVICGFGFENNQLPVLGGKAVEGVIAATGFSRDTKNQMVQNFITEFEAEHSILCTRDVVNGYDAVYAMAAAVEAAGTIDGEAVAKQLRTLQFTGLGGDFSFDENGEVRKTALLAILKNGKWTSLDY